MADESRSETRPVEAAAVLPDAGPESQPLERQVEPLRREVEAPRTAAGLWLPFMALASAAMLTITSGIAVMTRPPRVHIDGAETTLPAAAPRTPEQTQRQQRAEAQARLDGQPRVLCRVAVHRGNLDGDTQPYDECIVSPDVAAKASTGPAVR